MAKVARLAAIFGGTGAASSLLGWAVRLPFFNGLAAWTLIAYVIALALALALDDAAIAHLNITPETYYGSIGLGFGAALLGALLIWIA
jgi:hypothetical protein